MKMQSTGMFKQLRKIGASVAPVAPVQQFKPQVVKQTVAPKKHVQIVSTAMQAKPVARLLQPKLPVVKSQMTPQQITRKEMRPTVRNQTTAVIARPQTVKQAIAQKQVVKQQIVGRQQAPLVQKIVASGAAKEYNAPKSVKKTVLPATAKVAAEKSKADFVLPANRPAGRVAKENGQIFIYGDDGWLYQWVDNGVGLGNFGGLFKKVKKLVKKVAKVATKIPAKISTSIGVPVPVASALTYGGAAMTAYSLLKKKKGKKRVAIPAAASVPVTQPVTSTQSSAPTTAPSSLVTGGGGGSPVTIPSESLEPNVPAQATAPKNSMLIFGLLGLGALLMFKRKA